MRSGSIYRGGSPYNGKNSPGLVSDDGMAWTGGIMLRVRPDGTGLQVIADNFRNQYEIARDSYGNLFTEDNDDDGYVSLINPDGSVHTPKWIGATRDGLELHDPLGSAISNGVLYTVDSGYVRLFDLATGRPERSIPVPGSTLLNGIAVADDGTIYASNTRPTGQLWKVTAGGEVSLFAEGAPLEAPNGVAIDQDGNIVVVNVGDNAVLTYDPAGSVIRTERSVEGGNDGVVVTADGTKYVSSVRHGSVSRIRPGQEAEIIASGIPSAASMCYDSIQHQLVIPLNPNYALAFVRLD